MTDVYDTSLLFVNAAVKNNIFFLICQVKKLMTDITEFAFKALKGEQHSAGALLPNT